MPTSELLPLLFTQLLFTKEGPLAIIANHSHRSLQKSDLEGFAPVALYKRVTGAIRSFSRANGSFAHKNERFAQAPESKFPALKITD